jgi:hypothetical protein
VGRTAGSPHNKHRPGLPFSPTSSGRHNRSIFRTRRAVFTILSCKNFPAARHLLEEVAQIEVTKQETQMKLAILSAVASVALAIPASSAFAQQPVVETVSPGPVVVSPPPVVVSAPPVVVARPPLVVVAPPVLPGVVIARPGVTIGIGGYPYYGYYGRPYYGPYHYYHR